MPSRSSPVEHQLAVTRTARYFTLGDPATARQVWFAIHGYGQLAATFLGHLATLSAPSRLIVAPEALSRFYLSDGRGPPGASWMTKEDRQNEIADYVNYLDQVSDEVRGTCAAGARYLGVGFSQGVATLGRWLDRGAAGLDGCCFWAGTLPPEMDLTRQHPALAGRPVALVVGDRDEYFGRGWLESESRRLASAAAGEVRTFSFAGGHRLDRTVLSSVAGFLEGPSVAAPSP
jgi:predicted esterase